MSTATASAAAATTSAASGLHANKSLKVVGVILAIMSGVLIGSSFVFKKRGLLASQKGQAAGEGVAYLKSPLWWTGMTMMILGELCNFAAYAFVDAIVVTPMGALSVVISAILSSMFLKETLTFFGWTGCFLCIVGSIIIALNGPQEQAVTTISQFQVLFLSWGFLVYASVLIIGALVIVFHFAPKYGKKHMIWYILVCSMIGGISVSCIQGLGAAIVTTAQGTNQFKQWFTYFLIIFVTVTLLTEIYYLNVALALFNTAMVTPTYYVIFTGCTLVTSVVLYQGLKAPVMAIITVVMGFFVICAGIIILQMSKVDPESLSRLDRKSTILLQAARSNIETSEKGLSGIEDPGMDALRGSFGTVGSIIRARSARRMSRSSRGSQVRSRAIPSVLEEGEETNALNRLSTHGLDHLPRHQLYDAPMRAQSPSRTSNETNRPASPTSQPRLGVPSSPNPTRSPTIKFGSEDVAHFYPSPGKGGSAIHQPRAGHYGGLASPPPRGSSLSAQSAPPMQPVFRGGAYSDPFATPSSGSTPRSAGPIPSKSSGLLAPYGDDEAAGSVNSIPTIPSAHDTYEAPASRPSSHRYPSRGDDDPTEHERLVDTTRRGDSTDSESDPGLKAGAIRLLPKIPK